MNDIVERFISSQKRMPHGIGLKELAQKAGYSMSTVSKALNNSREISAATKKKISALATQYHYVPNKNACALRKRKTNQIMVYIPKFELREYAAILEGIMTAALHSGYQVVLNQYGSDMAESIPQETKAINHVDGVVLLSTNAQEDPEERFEQNDDWEIPTISFLRPNGSPKDDLKDRQFGEKMCQSLIKSISQRDKIPLSYSRV